MCERHAARGRKYELLACVIIIQREGCMRVNGYHKYELLACVSIIQHEGVSTSCWYVSASYSARAACVRTSTADTSCLRVLASYSEGCIRADEYQYERKYEGRYELLACIGIIRREGASTSAGTISKLFLTQKISVLLNDVLLSLCSERSFLLIAFGC